MHMFKTDDMTEIKTHADAKETTEALGWFEDYETVDVECAKKDIRITLKGPGGKIVLCFLGVVSAKRLDRVAVVNWAHLLKKGKNCVWYIEYFYQTYTYHEDFNVYVESEKLFWRLDCE